MIQTSVLFLSRQKKRSEAADLAGDADTGPEVHRLLLLLTSPRLGFQSLVLPLRLDCLVFRRLFYP